jgi:hypothetical protein
MLHLCRDNEAHVAVPGGVCRQKRQCLLQHSEAFCVEDLDGEAGFAWEILYSGLPKVNSLRELKHNVNCRLIAAMPCRTLSAYTWQRALRKVATWLHLVGVRWTTHNWIMGLFPAGNFASLSRGQATLHRAESDSLTYFLKPDLHVQVDFPFISAIILNIMNMFQSCCLRERASLP